VKARALFDYEATNETELVRPSSSLPRQTHNAWSAASDRFVSLVVCVPWPVHRASRRARS
jgi:hypothetical protein